MKFGFMPHFEENLFSEIEFAKQNFDFFELTLQTDLTVYTPDHISKIKKVLNGFEILGHLHWEIDLSQEELDDLVYKSVNIFGKIGIKKLTVHPSINKTLSTEKLRKNNIKNLTKISILCKENNIVCCIENISEAPFNRASEIEYLINKIPNSNITFDVGHALRISEEEFNRFLKLGNRIKHIHLHNVIEDKDHLFFYEQHNLLNRLDKLKNALDLDTITLEMFANIKNNQFHYKISSGKRHNLLLKQLRYLMVLRQI
ncbi:sugar phosphate isomerase/epimerase [Candidatus Micrarchaeota archaeon]|nr:sugar phosphate isomerase/epimerase [Candidatus Micrarchaeota archaeon]